VTQWSRSMALASKLHGKAIIKPQYNTASRHD
jgi:hypothetical protein